MKTAITLLALLGMGAGAVVAQTGQALDPEFGFPAPVGEMEAAVWARDVLTIRRHMWRVFAGITQPVQHGKKPVVWETWPDRQHTFEGKKLEDFSSAELEAPKQLREFTSRFTPLPEPARTPELFRMWLPVSTVRFNARAHWWITNKFNRFYELAQLSAMLSPPAAFTDLPAFPRDAIAVKAVWWPAKNTGDSVIPVWNGKVHQCYIGREPLNDHWSTWERLVVVDPKKLPQMEFDTVTVEFCSTCPNRNPDVFDPNRRARRVALDSFYWRKIGDLKLTPKQSAALRALFTVLYGDATPMTDDDRVVLIGMHFITKETPDWLWGTVWWHDQAKLGPFADDRPEELFSSDPWRNYLMDVAFDPAEPRLAPEAPPIEPEPPTSQPACKPLFNDDFADITFNPWLEGPLTRGSSSNCMACHQRATWGHKLTSVQTDTTRGRMSRNDPFFKEKLRTDYLWSFFDQVQEPK